MKEVHATVGTLDEMGSDFVAAWNRALAGDDQPVEVIQFDTADNLLRVLSPKRLELLRSLRLMSSVSVFALAKHLGRDYKNVHSDVKLLEQYGLIARDGEKITAPYDVIHADFDLRKAA